MANKKHVMERLSALKPAVPTNTRVVSETPDVSTEPSVKEQPEAAHKAMAAHKRHSATVEASSAQTADITVSVPLCSDSYVMTEVKPGYISLIAENMSAMLRIREILLNEIGKINAIIIDTWKQSMIVSFDIFKTNAESIANIVNNVFVSSCKEKK
ncbi:MAG: hypothetical protein H7844_08485 [Nitrospirae bacterium YQR-1]